MFVSHERLLPVSFAVAAPRLADLAGGRLLEVSQTVYEGGMDYLVRVGPAGAVPGASRLVRVRFTEPAYREREAAIGLRWEVTGVTGGLFPALDADIRLSDAGDQGTRVSLTGSYRPPLGAVGAGLDRLLLHAVATVTMKTLLARAASVLEGASAEVGQPAAAWRPGPGPEPAAC